MTEHYPKLIFIDLETTGPNPSYDRITEIGIVEVSASGVQHWSTLVNPQAPIPPFVRHLTGIDEVMVRDAPLFDAIAEELLQRLEGGLFVAHNARFDYGFLRNAFKRLGTNLHCDVLCTVKLSRKLFPHEPKHSLDALIERHGLTAETRHRALSDADLLWQYWRTLESMVEADSLQAAIRHLLQRPSLPAHLDPDLLDDLPDSPGVFIFRGENDVVLHVGRAAQLRQRVLSYFQSERPSPKVQWLAREVRRIDWHETVGDLGAELLEVRLSSQLTPAQEPRHKLCAWQLQTLEDRSPRLVLRDADEHDFGRGNRLYGLFNTRQKAEKALQALAEKHGLDLESLVLAPAQGCACIASNTPVIDTERVEQALSSLKMLGWPYPGPIVLIETSRDGRQDIHLLDNWCHLGTVPDERDVWLVLQEAPPSPAFDPDIYRIVSRALASGKTELRCLDRLAPAVMHTRARRENDTGRKSGPYRTNDATKDFGKS